jgi:Na+/melibiose symporter-like transporter
MQFQHMPILNLSSCDNSVLQITFLLLRPLSIVLVISITYYNISETVWLFFSRYNNGGTETVPTQLCPLNELVLITASSND